MPRLGWILLAVTVTATVVGLIGAAMLLAGDSPEETVPIPIDMAPREPELPLTADRRALTLADHAGPVLVGLATRPGGPVEIAAVDGQDPIARSALSVDVDGKSTRLEPCGHACSRARVAALDGRRHTVTVAVRGSARLRFDLPAALPPSGTALFRQVRRTMGSLRSYRYRERLTSGVGSGVTTTFEAQAPNRLRFRTASGFRSVMVGRSRWDFRGGRWERSPFSGLRTSSFMWDGARNARVIGEATIGGRRAQVLSVFDLDPVPAWFRLRVAGGRVLEAEMLAPSHFMEHRFSDFNRPFSIEPPA